jgi:RNA 3'-terminal phosphate cyclase (ATP)
LVSDISKGSKLVRLDYVGDAMLERVREDGDDEEKNCDRDKWRDALRDAIGRGLYAGVGDQCIGFVPKVTDGIHGNQTFIADPQTAGSIALMIQVSLPILLFANGSGGGSAQGWGVEGGKPKSTVILKGGTNAANAPQVDYITRVFLKVLEGWMLPRPTSLLSSSGTASHPISGGQFVDIRVEKRGYYPKGGGVVYMDVRPLVKGQFLRPIVLLERGEAVKICGRIYVAGKLGLSFAEKVKNLVMERLRRSGVFEEILLENAEKGIGEEGGIEIIKDAPGVSVGDGAGAV